MSKLDIFGMIYLYFAASPTPVKFLSCKQKMKVWLYMTVEDFSIYNCNSIAYVSAIYETIYIS